MTPRLLLPHLIGLWSSVPLLRLRARIVLRFIGAFTWTRTKNLSVNSRLLCQLSYEGIYIILKNKRARRYRHYLELFETSDRPSGNSIRTHVLYNTSSSFGETNIAEGTATMVPEKRFELLLSGA